MNRIAALPRFLCFYAALFAAFGVASPFLPGLMQQHGLHPGELGLVLAAGTAIRLVAGPLGGRIADRVPRPAMVLAVFAGTAALIAVGYVPARDVMWLLLVSVFHAAVLAPLTPVADALALGSAYSDDVAQSFRLDVAHRSDLMSPSIPGLCRPVLSLCGLVSRCS